MRKVLVILGPTATGKTDLAIKLAKKFSAKGGGELVACDSRQVYKGLDIGTGKMPSNATYEVRGTRPRRSESVWIINGVKIWMYDVADPKIQYTVADYVKDATKVIEDITNRGKLPIIVGGTGLYLKGLLEGIPNLAVPVDEKLREKLEKLSLLELQEKLKELSPAKWEKLNESDRQNPRRLVRTIELSMSSLRMQGSNKQSYVRNWIPAYAGMTDVDVFKTGLTAQREVLYKNADQRVLTRIDQGMIEEAKNLYKGGLSLKRMRELGLEYGVLADYLSGEIRDIEGDRGLIKIMQGKIHRFIRRQLTWFKKEKNVHWFDITGRDFPENVEKMVSIWYASN